jgi:hypothetical protein
MEEGAFAAQLLAGLFFGIAGARLLRLSFRTGEAPERLLGSYFALTGVAYLLWVLPNIVALGTMAESTDFAAWVVYCVGVAAYLVFTRIVFRQESRWPHGIVVGCLLALALSTTVLTLRGDRYPHLDNPFYWIQWVGYTVPCVWMTLEALQCRRNAWRRAQIGLADPVVMNRYLLLALFGAFQVIACLSDILLTIDFAADQAASGLADLLLGGFELAGIAALWLVFFPPQSYLDWVTGSSRTADEAA